MRKALIVLAAVEIVFGCRVVSQAGSQNTPQVDVDNTFAYDDTSGAFNWTIYLIPRTADAFKHIKKVEYIASNSLFSTTDEDTRVSDRASAFAFQSYARPSRATRSPFQVEVQITSDAGTSRLTHTVRLTNPRGDTDEGAVFRALKGYERGFNAHDSGAIRDVYPTVNDRDLKLAFSVDYKRFTRLVEVGRIQVSGSAADAWGILRDDAEAKVGRFRRQPSNPLPFSAKISKKDGAWKIETIKVAE
jgi:hypothetical protein